MQLLTLKRKIENQFLGKLHLAQFNILCVAFLPDIFCRGNEFHFPLEHSKSDQIKTFGLGLEKLHLLTKQRGCRVRFDLWSFDGDHAFAKYRYFISKESN